MTTRQAEVDAEIGEILVRPKFEYPFEESEAPKAGTIKPVAEGVYWVRMPLPFALEWINLWLLRDGDGWTLVDTGIGGPKSEEHWTEIFENHLDGLPIHRIIVTHMHPDHVGMAGWISRKFDCDLYMSRLEYTTCRMLIADTGREAPDVGVRFYERAGWGEEELAKYKSRFGGFGSAITQLPDAFIRLEDGDDVEIDNSVWRVITGEGHCPEHVCLFNEDKNLFISGDQLLPRISSNVSVFPTEPESDPLKLWMNSCEKLHDALPDNVLVLPAHNLPFRGAHQRLKYLIKGHETVLQRIERKLEKGPMGVVELFPTVFGRMIEKENWSLATGETIAHLNCLMHRGIVERQSSPGAADTYFLRQVS